MCSGNWCENELKTCAYFWMSSLLKKSIKILFKDLLILKQNSVCHETSNAFFNLKMIYVPIRWDKVILE